MAGPIRASITADAKEFKRAVDQVEAGADDMAQAARQAGNRMETAFDSAGSAADGTASATSQAAGGIGDIAGALEATGLISEGTAQSLAVVEASIMGATGVADLANLAFEKMKLGMIATRIQTIATSAATKVWTGVQAAFNAVMALNPIALVIIAIIALIAIIVLAYKNSETFRRIVDKVWAGLRKAIKVVWDKIRPFFSWLGGVFKKVWQGISRTWNGTLWPFFKGIPGRISRGIGNLRSLLLQKGKDVLNGMKRGVVWAWDHSIIGWLWNRKSAIKRGIGNLGSTLWSAGSSLLRGLRDGIEYAWDTYVKPLLSRITDLIPDWKGPIEKDRKLLAPAGAAIMEGFADSLDDSFNTRVRRVLSRATSTIAGTSIEAPSTIAGGGQDVNVVIQTGVGDPVAIGGAVAKALRAYVGAGGRVQIA